MEILKRFNVLRVFLCGVILAVSGCGGGTSGSDDGGRLRSATIIGTVVTEQGEPIQGALIRSASSAEQARSDSRGAFSLTSPVVSRVVTLEVQAGNLYSPVDLIGFSDAVDQQAEVTIQVGATISVVSVRIEPLVPLSPTSTPTPGASYGNGSEAPRPTAGPITPPTPQFSKLVVKLLTNSPIQLNATIEETGTSQLLSFSNRAEFEFPAALRALTFVLNPASPPETIRPNTVVPLSSLPGVPARITVELSLVGINLLGGASSDDRLSVRVTRVVTEERR